MEILRVSFEAGESHSFHKSGKYFEVMKASAPFDAWLTDRAIGVYPCIGLEAGVFSELPFQSFELKSATAQTVTLLISDFRAGFRAGGAVSGGGGSGSTAFETYAEILEKEAAGGFLFTGNIGSSASTCPVVVFGAPAGKKLTIKDILLNSGSTWAIYARGSGIGTIETGSGISPAVIRAITHAEPVPIIKHGAGANNFTFSAAEAPSAVVASLNVSSANPGSPLIMGDVTLTGDERFYIAGNFNSVIQYRCKCIVRGL
jgi:hypothetical protein